MSINNAIEAARNAGIPENVINAGAEFFRRKNRISNPPGEFDKAGRFYAEEVTEATRNCRAPSRAWPYAEMTAARTAAHCAEVYGAVDMLAYVKRISMIAEKGFEVNEATNKLVKWIDADGRRANRDAREELVDNLTADERDYMLERIAREARA